MLSIWFVTSLHGCGCVCCVVLCYLGCVTEVAHDLSDILDDRHIVLPAVAPELRH